jgi:hypothetical protein
MTERVVPTTPSYPPEIAEPLAGMTPPGRAPLALFTTPARNPPLAAAVNGLGSMVLCGWYHAVCFIARAARLRSEPFSASFAEFFTGGVSA